MARPRSGSAVGREWERHIRKISEKARQDSEQRKHEYNERMRAHLCDLPFRNSATDPIAQHFTSNLLQDETAHELDAGQYSRLQGKRAAPLTAKDSGLADTNVLELQSRVNRQEIAIKGFESDLRVEQAKTRRLQAERHEAVSAHRQAILVSDDVEIDRWKSKVSNLLELLDQSTHREKDLERQIEEGRARENDLRDRLRGTQRPVQEPGANIEVQRPRETPTQQRTVERPAGDSGMGVNTLELQRQQQETERRLRSIAQRQQDFEEELGTVQSTKFAPSSTISGRSRKQAVQMEARGYISVRKSSGRHGLLSF